MKQTFLLLILGASLVVMSGCESKDPIQETPKKDIKEEQVVETDKKKYPTLETYHKSISFLNVSQLDTPPEKDLFYDSGKGIQKINIAKFYKKHKADQKALEEKRKDLTQARLLKTIKRVPAKKDPIQTFLQDKNQGPLKDPMLQAQENKKMKQQLEKQYKNQTNEIILGLEAFQKLEILLEEDGSYAKAEKVRKERCEKYPTSCETFKLTVSGWVKDDELNPLPNSKITVFNQPGKKFFADEEGNYEFQLRVYPHQLFRVLYQSEGFMPQIKEFRVGVDKSADKMQLQVRMPGSHKTVTFEMPQKGKRITVASDRSKFIIRPGQLILPNGEPYVGSVVGYFYDFNPSEDDMGSVLEGSVRMVGGVVPASNLISYGMAYAEFWAEDGEPLRIRDDNPVIVQTEVMDEEKFYRDNMGEYADEDEFWNAWVDYSENEGAFRASQVEGVFPAYWVYNIGSGIWDEVALEVKARNNIQSIFYTHP